MQKVLMISIIFLLLLILSVLIFLFFKQRKRLDSLTDTLHELEEHQEIKAIKSNLAGRDQERTRIAKDWHDGIGNSLSTLRLLVDTIQAKNQERHTEVLTLLEHTQREFRQIIDDELINNFSTEIEVRKCLDQWSRQFALGNIELVFKVYNLLAYDKVPMKVKAHLYRITQELLTNALKYAAASKIQVELKMNDNFLLLSVSDNGKGQTEAFILRSVKDRLLSLNGEIQINTKENQGTLVGVRISLK